MPRIATYNVQKGIGLDARRNPGRTLDVIAEIDADIVALQEADRRFGDRSAALPAEMIAERTGLIPLTFAPHAAGIGWHGNAILVRRSAQVSDLRRIELPRLEPRGAVMATINTEGETEGTSLRIVATHLSLVSRVRARQLAHILTVLAEQEDGPPSVIMGDFNEWRSSARSLQTLLRSHALVGSGPSFPAPMPLGALDRIAVSADLRVTSAGVHRSKTATIASDHLPVWAEISTAGRVGRTTPGVCENGSD